MKKPAVLFLCTGNSIRSQMAEAFLKKHGQERFEAFSAGLAPVGIHPLTVKVMKEVGIDISGQSSKGVGEFLGKLTVHYAIFVCARAEDKCPTIWPWALNRLSWPFDDPAECEGTEIEILEGFRRVRESIEEKIKSWLAAL